MTLTFQESTTARIASGMGRQLKVLFVVEGYTDIRFVVGLSQICDLTILTPSGPYRESGLDQRILRSGARVGVDEIPGGRLRYQVGSFRYLWEKARDFDVILSQEILRGSLNSCLAGSLLKVPVVTYMNIPPLEYYRCRRERGQCGWVTAMAGESVIRVLMRFNGKLAARCVAVGPYLVESASQYCSRVTMGRAYGVDTGFYLPANDSERLQLRAKLNLPTDQFLVFVGSRISHEKDPGTVLRAVSLVRAQGMDAVVINLGGGYRDFVNLAEHLGLPKAGEWVLGRPAAHPMTELADYYRTADAVAQASLEEGAGMVPLEALACGTPVVCTAVGGMARILPGYARLTPRCDAEAMAKELLWVASNPMEARTQALSGRDYVIREWNRQKVFGDLGCILEEVSDSRPKLPRIAAVSQP
jgi:glycosyltransferase involved in cell wall biosynthesis